MNVIQSFYANTNDFGIFYQATYFTLSCLYAKQIGIDITLFTDYTFGEVVYPYNKIDYIFENTDIPNVDPLIWAWPKFIALDHCNRDTIHIDGDVFLQKPLCKQILTNINCDVLVQSQEHFQKGNMGWISTFEQIKHLVFPEWIEKKIPETMPNNGILCVKNEKLWDEYKKLYWSMAEQCTPGFITANGFCVPDIIFEQSFLEKLCEKNDYNIQYLFGTNEKEISINSKLFGYSHVCDGKKHLLKYTLRMIKKLDIKSWECLFSNFGFMFSEYFENN